MGCKLWFTILLPALLPFFIVAELMVSLGFVNFLGVILEPDNATSFFAYQAAVLW
jgi:hypothetical protein